MAESKHPHGLVPVFPLPDVVFFPDTVLPLHIFEPRYRSMVRHAGAGDGLIAMALLRPGWERHYEDSPAIHPFGTVGSIEDLQPLDDGRFNLRLFGLRRARYHEVQSETTYRLVEVEPLEEDEVDENEPLVRRVKLELLAFQGYLMREINGELNTSIVLDQNVPFATAVNECCANLPVEPEVRQSLLEEDRLLERGRAVSALSQEVLEQVLRLKDRASGGYPQPN